MPATRIPMTLVLLSSIAACAAPASEDVASLGEQSHASFAHPHAFDVGANEWTSELAPFEQFRVASGAPANEPRLCHVYTYWDIVHHDPAGGDQTHTLHGLVQWMAQAAPSCDEILVTFQGPQQKGAEAPPSVAQFESSFVAFARLTDPGQALASWKGTLSYTAWNEPNNKAGTGNGLWANLLARDRGGVLPADAPALPAERRLQGGGG